MCYTYSYYLFLLFITKIDYFFLILYKVKASNSIIMDFDLTEYNRIKAIGNSRLIAKELLLKSPEWREIYRKFKHKEINQVYHSKHKDANNAKRRDARRLIQENTPKPFEVIKNTIDIDNVDTSIKRDNKIATKINNLNDKTISNYINTIKIIYSKYHNNILSDDSDIIKLLHSQKYNPKSLLNDNLYIVNNINDIVLNYPSYVPILYNIFSRLNGKNLNIIRETLYPFFISFKDNYNSNRNNIVVNKDIVDKISFDKNIVLHLSSSIPDIFDKLIYLLLFLLPTRRLHDYRIARVASKSTDINNIDFNWYHQGKLYINNTKNKDKLVLDLPAEIINIINDLPYETDFLLGKSYSEPSLSIKFNKITSSIYGSPFNALDIRKIYASHNLKSNISNGNSTQIAINARNMGHSIHEHLKYANGF